MRVPFWDDRLYEALEKHRGLPTDYKQSDCFRLMMDAVEAVTGEKPYADEMGKYKTDKGAARRLKARKFKNLEEAVKALGYPVVSHSRAMRGDLVILSRSSHANMSPGEVAGGVVIGSEVVAKGQNGLERFPIDPSYTYYAVR